VGAIFRIAGHLHLLIASLDEWNILGQHLSHIHGAPVKEDDSIWGVKMNFPYTNLSLNHQRPRVAFHDYEHDTLMIPQCKMTWIDSNLVIRSIACI
jgi:hypothetical protein